VTRDGPLSAHDSTFSRCFRRKSAENKFRRIFSVFLESPIYWVFYLNILEKRTVGAAAGKAEAAKKGRPFYFPMARLSASPRSPVAHIIPVPPSHIAV
jgi:hypothetical protein